jgi:hypothetical protein
MTTITVPTAGDDIEAAWGASVANAINSTTRTSNASVTTTETQCVGKTFSANTLAAGTCIQLDGWFTITSTAANTVTFAVRIGTSSLSGTVAAQVAPTTTNTASNHSVRVTALVTIRSTGASGTAIGGMSFVAIENQPFTVGHRTDQETATITVDTTVSNVVELTVDCSAGTTTAVCRQAFIQLIAP